jgi:diguanylate cyclase (GGDEF)-like protein
VVACDDGEAAFALLCAEDGPRLAVLDWMMPGLDGPEICRKIRELEGNGDAYRYLLLLTSRDAKEDVVEGLASGADDYVTKPFALPELEARLRTGRRILTLETQLRKERKDFEHRAQHDALTGLWNRRAVMDHLARELDRGSRKGSCVGLIYADIDHFKRVNDTYGHPVGDEVLVNIARALEKQLRNYDGVGRFGGEEFVTVVTCNNEREVHALGERLRKRVESQTISTTAGPLRITMSVGIASTVACGYNEAKLVKSADSALYAAKKQGRNRSVLFFDVDETARLGNGLDDDARARAKTPVTPPKKQVG